MLPFSTTSSLMTMIKEEEENYDNDIKTFQSSGVSVMMNNTYEMKDAHKTDTLLSGESFSSSLTLLPLLFPLSLLWQAGKKKPKGNSKEGNSSSSSEEGNINSKSSSSTSKESETNSIFSSLGGGGDPNKKR